MVKQTLKDIFTECQRGLQSHGKLIKSLKKIYDSMNLDDFWNEFQGLLKYSMIVFKREPAVERTLDFVAKFTTSLSVQAKENEKPEEAKEGEEQSLAEEMEEENKLLLKLFGFLLESHNARDRAVRFRCCQMINKLLNNLGENAQIDDDLYDKVYESMLRRLRDKFPIVRVQAVTALARLQDPQDKDCPVIEAYLFLLGSDPNPDVRRAVLSYIACSTKTLPAILERTRDAKESVRKLAYQVIAEKVHIKALTIAQRVRLLQDGLNDRTDLVKDACKGKLLQSWLRVWGGNVLDLLKCLDVENSMETCQIALKALFEKIPVEELVQNFDLVNEQSVLEFKKLSPESVLYWRCLCEHIKSLGDSAEEQLDKILPNGTAFCSYIESVRSTMKENISSNTDENMDQELINEYILHQLLTLAGVLDLSDEVGRKSLNKLIREMLVCTTTSHTLVEPLILRLHTIHPDDNLRISNLVEVISEIRQPITTIEDSMSADEQRKLDLKLAGVRVELNQLREELDDCIKNQEFGKAAEIKARITELDASKASILDEGVPKTQEIREEKNDPGTLLKCLTITTCMLQDVSMKSLSPTLQTLMETLILPCIPNEDPAVRNQAVKALGLSCLLSKDTARAHLLLFMQISRVDACEVQITALHVIFDLLHTFGMESFDVDEDEEENAEDVELPKEEADERSEVESTTSSTEKMHAGKTTKSILSILIGLLDEEGTEIRTAAAEGLAKLLLSGRVLSSKLLSRLILLWYNPVTEGDSHLRHCLGAFFPMFAFAGRSNQELVAECFTPTLRTLFNAPATSPLAEVNVNNVSELLVQLTSAKHLMNNNNSALLQETSLHDDIAIRVCNDILEEPNSFNVRNLCKILNSLELTPTNATNNKDLKVLADQMVAEVKDKQCAKTLEKFQKSLTDMISLNESQIERSVQEVNKDKQVESVTTNQDEEPEAERNEAAEDKDNQKKDAEEDQSTGTQVEAKSVEEGETEPDEGVPTAVEASKDDATEPVEVEKDAPLESSQESDTYKTADDGNDSSSSESPARKTARKTPSRKGKGEPETATPGSVTRRSSRLSKSNTPAPSPVSTSTIATLSSQKTGSKLKTNADSKTKKVPPKNDSKSTPKGNTKAAAKPTVPKTGPKAAVRSSTTGAAKSAPAPVSKAANKPAPELEEGESDSEDVFSPTTVTPLRRSSRK
ncbi:unnamed protein product, partial [Owenia fusiformis]